MNKVELIAAIQAHASHPKKVIEEVLQGLGVVVSGELMANEPAPLPYLGQLLPVDVPQGRNTRVRQAQFQPGRDLRKKLRAPLRRARAASR